MRTDADGLVWYYLTTGIIGREIYVMSAVQPTWYRSAWVISTTVTA